MKVTIFSKALFLKTISCNLSYTFIEHYWTMVKGEGLVIKTWGRLKVRGCFQISSSFNAAAFRYKTEYFFDIDFYHIILSSHGSGQIYTDFSSKKEFSRDWKWLSHLSKPVDWIVKKPSARLKKFRIGWQEIKHEDIEENLAIPISWKSLHICFTFKSELKFAFLLLLKSISYNRNKVSL